MVKSSFLEDEFRKLVAERERNPQPIRPMTPSPWTYTRSPRLGSIDGCEVKGATEFVGYIYNEADARLIAAAPDMLQALQEVFGDCYHLHFPGAARRSCMSCLKFEGDPHDPCCPMQTVIAALAKAEGT